MLGGSRLSWQDGKVYEVDEGGFIVHRARAEAHSCAEGTMGSTMLAFRRTGGDGHATLPRAGCYLARIELGRVRPGRPSVGPGGGGRRARGREPAERPKNIVNVADLEQERWIDLADAAGSAKSS